MSEASMVFVGRKPMAVYLAKVITLLASNDRVVIVARGQFVLKAIRVGVRAARATGCECHVNIDEEKLESDEREIWVPKIEITLVKRS